MLKESEIRPSELMKGQVERHLADVERLLKHKHNFIVVPCPACGSHDHHRIYEKYGIQFVACNECETNYASPRPRPEHLDDYYSHSENYAYWNQYIFPASESARREKIFKPRVQKVLDICKKFDVTTHTLLEVGAGFGIFCEEIQKTQTFNRIIGVEPTSDLAQTCRNRGIEIIEKPIEQVDFGKEEINVIANFEVIEHLFCPREFILKCYELLVSGGIFILTCPNSKGFDILTLGEQSSAVDNEHLNMFNVSSLSKLLENCGFEVIEAQTLGKLDTELVRNQIIAGNFDVSNQPFLKHILIDDWEHQKEPFQNFLSANNLSSNMLLVARKP